MGCYPPMIELSWCPNADQLLQDMGLVRYRWLEKSHLSKTFSKLHCNERHFLPNAFFPLSCTHIKATSFSEVSSCFWVVVVVSSLLPFESIPFNESVTHTILLCLLLAGALTNTHGSRNVLRTQVMNVGTSSLS